MKPDVVLAFEFVEFIPEELRERTLYISGKYATAVHKCCCGCGREVVTPLAPSAWHLTFDGTSVTLHPSIGSWGLPCQSHYVIRRNKVLWAPRWSQEQIAAGRAREARAKDQYYGTTDGVPEETAVAAKSPVDRNAGLWQKVRGWFS